MNDLTQQEQDILAYVRRQQEERWQQAVCGEQPGGRKDDTGKTRWDLVPWSTLDEVAQVLTAGAAKYGDENWRAVPDAQRRYFAALLRHVMAWWGDEVNDPDDGLPHLIHAICCLMFLRELNR